MTEILNNQNGQKTIVTFIAGLLIGGLLVWVFTSPSDGDQSINETSSEDKTTSDEGNSGASSLKINDTVVAGASVQSQNGVGQLNVPDQPAGSSVALGNTILPDDEGWVGVRDFKDGNMGYILGVVRFNKSQGLIPATVVLQRPTISGQDYVVVVYAENGDRTFDLRSDFMVDDVLSSFRAQ